MHIRLNMSVITLDLIAMSRGESTANDGDKLDSRTHGLRLLSKRISKPYSSKQLFLKPGILFYSGVNMTINT